MYKRLRDLREDHDLSQTEVAKILHMSQTGYSKYETGENDIPTHVLISLADFYHTSVLEGNKRKCRQENSPGRKKTGCRPDKSSSMHDEEKTGTR